MIMIVINHYALYGFDFQLLPYSFNKYLIDAIAMFGKVGSNGFIFISAWFMIDSKFTIKKFLKLEFQVIFYSLLGFFIFLIIGAR